MALTREIPGSIQGLLAEEREVLPVGEATTAVFYSISNCQPGLRGVSFGNFLIKQVVEELSRELPSLTTFVTLSPVPGFAAWLAKRGLARSSRLAGTGTPRRRSALEPSSCRSRPPTSSPRKAPAASRSTRWPGSTWATVPASSA